MNTKRLPRLCLVEDDEIMGESLVDRFRLEGFHVDWHRRAGEAHRALGRAPYDVVVSDIQLPDFTGEVLFARLHEAGVELPPFIFVTGHGSIERAVALLRAGAADVGEDEAAADRGSRGRGTRGLMTAAPRTPVVRLAMGVTDR